MRKVLPPDGRKILLKLPINQTSEWSKSIDQIDQEKASHYEAPHHLDTY